MLRIIALLVLAVSAARADPASGPIAGTPPTDSWLDAAPVTDVPLAGSWYCTWREKIEGRLSSTTVGMELHPDGRYDLHLDATVDRAEGPVTISVSSAGDWSRDGSVLETTTRELVPELLFVDGKFRPFQRLDGAVRDSLVASLLGPVGGPYRMEIVRLDEGSLHLREPVGVIRACGRIATPPPAPPIEELLAGDWACSVDRDAHSAEIRHVIRPDGTYDYYMSMETGSGGKPAEVRVVFHGTWRVEQRTFISVARKVELLGFLVDGEEADLAPEKRDGLIQLLGRLNGTELYSAIVRIDADRAEFVGEGKSEVIACTRAPEAD